MWKIDRCMTLFHALVPAGILSWSCRSSRRRGTGCRWWSSWRSRAWWETSAGSSAICRRRCTRAPSVADSAAASTRRISSPWRRAFCSCDACDEFRSVSVAKQNTRTCRSLYGGLLINNRRVITSQRQTSSHKCTSGVTLQRITVGLHVSWGSTGSLGDVLCRRKGAVKVWTLDDSALHTITRVVSQSWNSKKQLIGTRRSGLLMTIIIIIIFQLRQLGPYKPTQIDKT